MRARHGMRTLRARGGDAYERLAQRAQPAAALQRARAARARAARRQRRPDQGTAHFFGTT